MRLQMAKESFGSADARFIKVKVVVACSFTLQGVGTLREYRSCLTEPGINLTSMNIILIVYAPILQKASGIPYLQLASIHLNDFPLSRCIFVR